MTIKEVLNTTPEEVTITIGFNGENVPFDRKSKIARETYGDYIVALIVPMNDHTLYAEIDVAPRKFNN